MSTKHVILGLLDIMPMSGYDLAQNLKISLESLWSASYSQIYPTLHKLTADGLVTGAERVGPRQRIVYSLTTAGRKELHAWLHEPVQYLPFRDPFKLWASYLDVVAPEVAWHAVERHIAQNLERADYLESIVASISQGEHPLIRVREARLPHSAAERLKATRAMIFSELALQARQEAASAERIRAFLRELYPDFAPSAQTDSADKG